MQIVVHSSLSFSVPSLDVMPGAERGKAKNHLKWQQRIRIVRTTTCLIRRCQLEGRRYGIGCLSPEQGNKHGCQYSFSSIGATIKEVCSSMRWLVSFSQKLDRRF